MTTAIIGTGGIGSVIARQLASGGETLRLSPAVLFYATDDDRASEEVERLIRTAGSEPAKVGGIEQSGRLEVGGDLHDLLVGPAEARSLISGASSLRRPDRGTPSVGPSPRRC
jgi:predicted dinucleotide-binding enzyme